VQIPQGFRAVTLTPEQQYARGLITREELEAITVCGNCRMPAERTPQNEGYSECCNDRIEDAEENTLWGNR